MAGAGMEAMQGVYRWVDITSAQLGSWTQREDSSLERELEECQLSGRLVLGFSFRYVYVTWGKTFTL